MPGGAVVSRAAPRDGRLELGVDVRVARRGLDVGLEEPGRAAVVDDEVEAHEDESARRQPAARARVDGGDAGGDGGPRLAVVGRAERAPHVGLGRDVVRVVRAVRIAVAWD